MSKNETEIQPLERPDPPEDEEDAKNRRCAFFQFDDNIPRNYTENSSKEELVLEHVLEYQRQFKIIYDPTRELLLAPLNECGKAKFICTTIRPTKLPFTELYEYESCAKFISNYLEYEELTEPMKLPRIIPSPANVLEWQVGDSFDYSIVLCSLLLGCGYDAYVVYGTAPKEITTKDESLMTCPFDTTFNDLMEKEDPQFDKDEEHMQKKKEELKEPMPFSVEIKTPYKSVFDDEQKEKFEKDSRLAHLKATTIDDDEPDYEPDDEYGRSRLHAWILIQKGAREMTESIFIEPTTARKYTLDNAPYHSIQAIYNQKNFWVNLDPTREIEEINLDFQDDLTGEWEYVMLQPGKKTSEDEDNEEDNDDDEDEDELPEEVLDMPPPWCPKLFINRDKFADGTPGGEKTVFYKKCKVDFYSECKQVDGLVKRISIYEDYKRLVMKEIRSYYANRKDMLIMRRRFPYEFKLVEHYESSEKTNHWKKLVQIDGHRRILYFYHHRNKDGLIYREEEIGSKTQELFKNREDRLVYRSVTFDAEKSTTDNQNLTLQENHTGQVQIKKMIQKFDMDLELPSEDQIKKTEFNIKKGMVYIHYHYQKGRITAKDEEYKRDKLIGVEKTTEYEKENEENKDSQKYKQIYSLEIKCHDQIKESEKDAKQEMELRSDNERAIVMQRSQPSEEKLFKQILQKSIYAKARDKMKQGQKKEEEEAGANQERDYLAPILKKLCLKVDNKDEPLEPEAAISVKNEALRSLKERLLTRAEIIQRRLEQEQKKLEEAYQNLKRKGDNFGSDQQKEYEQTVEKVNFRMDILTERAAQHYRNSLQKFQELDQKLMTDKRLEKLNNNSKAH